MESNRIIREGRILKAGGGFHTICFSDSDGGIKVKELRLFATKVEAEVSLRKMETKRTTCM